MAPGNPGQVSIHHTRLMQSHPGVHSLRGHRGSEGDLGEQGPSQGAGAESGTGTTPQILDSVCEPDPKPAVSAWPVWSENQVDQKTAILDLGEVCAHLPSRGDGHTESSGSTESLTFRAFLPIVLLAMSFIWLFLTVVWIISYSSHALL